ncbi:virion structural protein [Vibrio phage BONAISHI]|nr:virion structural protein [Vibrio phage BONAISHI]
MSYAFDTYRDETMALARSVVLKYEVQNTLINEAFKSAGAEVLEDPKTWKYNLNLSGEYHYNDTRMTVVSSDTQQEINFDKTTLVNHPRTIIDYSPDGDFYDSLVTRYPNNRIIIRGITKPIDIDTVVTAKDFQILDYNSALIASNETLLIKELQEWIDRYVARWWNPDFIISDPLYPACFLSVMYAHMPAAIMNIRLKYAKTRFASQFHIWSYLGGHYELDNYQDHLSQAQALWLYRNIVDIRSRAGRRDRLTKLIENLTTPVGVSIDNMRFVQTYQNLNDEGKPVSQFSFNDIESPKIDFTSANLYTVRNVHNLTEDKAIANAASFDSDVERVQQKADRVRYDDLPTKILRAKEDGTVVSQTIEVLSVKLDYWIYLATNNIYNPSITITLPDGSVRSMPAKDLIILMIYALNKAQGVEKNDIPNIEVKGVVPLVYPIRAQIDRLAHPDYVTEEDIQFLYDNTIDIFGVDTDEKFELLAERVIEVKLAQELRWESKRTPLAQSVLQDLSSAFWSRSECVLNDQYSTFNSWLVGNRIDGSRYTEQDWFSLAQEILVQTIDNEQINGVMSTRQSAIVEILDRLTSYNIMIIKEGAARRSKRLEIPNTMIYNPIFGAKSTYDIETGMQYLTHLFGTKWQMGVELDLSTDMKFTPDNSLQIKIDPVSDIKVKAGQTLHRTLQSSNQHFYLNDN